MAEMSGGLVATAPMTAALGTTGVPRAAGQEKTAIFATAAIVPGDFEKTAIHQANAVQKQDPDFEKTAIHQTNAVQKQGPDFEKTAVHQPGVAGRPAPVTTSTPDVEI